MRFAFTSEQRQLQQATREVLAKECTPALVRAAWTNESGRIPGLWAKLAEQGIVGLTVPEAHGGMGLSELDLVLILEETGRAALPEPIVETTAVAGPLLAELGRTEELESIATGKLSVSVGLDWSPFIVGAHAVDRLIVTRGDEIQLIHSSLAKLNAQPSVDGSRRLFKVDWKRDVQLATGPRAQEALHAACDRGALGTSAQLLGVARQLIDVTVAYTKVREQFGKPIGSFQAVKHHLANALVKLEFARPLVYRAAYSMSQRDPDRSLHVAMAKSSASDAALLATRVALQCHGAIGYAYEHDLHLWMKRAWALASAWGDAAWHRARVGNAIIDRNTGARHG